MILKNQYTGSSSVSIAFDPVDACQLDSVELHLGAASATSENLVISIDDNTGAAYDVVLLTQDMNTLADLVYQPDRPIELVKGDKINITWTNTNTETYGITIKTRSV